MFGLVFDVNIFCMHNTMIKPKISLYVDSRKTMS